MKDLYELISVEIENTSDGSLPEVYPSFIVMYEFFRLLRGEGFHGTRPSCIGQEQKEIYRLGDTLLGKLKEKAKKLNPRDDKTIFHLNQAKNLFEIK